MPLAAACRQAIAPFAELERAPEHVHTYRLTPLGLWNARAAGHDAEQVVDVLLEYSRYPVPHALLVDVAETMARYGRLQLVKHPAHGLVLHALDVPVLEEVLRSAKVKPLRRPAHSTPSTCWCTPASAATSSRSCSSSAGPPRTSPATSTARRTRSPSPSRAGASGPTRRRPSRASGTAGSGVVVLPCGAGKTIVGAAAMARASATTLILVTNTVSARQWRDELLKRTSLTEDEIGEYSGSRKEIRPVTIATYQVMTTKRKGVYAHLELFDARDWGLVDLRRGAPAAGADLPDDRRPAGPPPPRPHRHPGPRGRPRGRRLLPDRPEALRRPVEGHRGAGLHRARRLRRGPRHAARTRPPAYATAEPEERYRLCSTAAEKTKVVERLVAQHRGEPTLVIGQYIDQLDDLGERLDAPVLKGETPVKERQRLFEAFRHGEITTLVVSKVANFSIDLPGGQRGHPGLGVVRVAPGGGAAPGPGAPAQGRRPGGPLLRDRRPRHPRPGVRRAPPALPGGAGLCLPDHRRGRVLPGPATPGSFDRTVLTQDSGPEGTGAPWVA